MATNKNALTRYLALDRCFRNPGRNYNINALLEACNEALAELDGNASGIKKRQLYEDIRFMESKAGYDVEFQKTNDGRDVYYRYANPDFSISNRGLNESEKGQISSALLLISRFKGMPQFEWIEEMIAKFESSFNLKSGTEKIIGFDQNLDYTAVRNISPLFNAIHFKTVLNVTYKSFRSTEPEQINFHPYYLKQFNNRWFCFGFNEKADAISNLALDRIINIKEIKKKYISNDSIDFNWYFEEVIGVTVQGKVEKVKLEIGSGLWPYIETKPLHGTQKVVGRSNDSVTITIEVKLNYELQSLLLSHGENIKVIEPVELRNLLSARIKKMK